MNNINEVAEDNNSKYPRTICTGSTVILKYAILHLLLKLCTILGSLVPVMRVLCLEMIDLTLFMQL